VQDNAFITVSAKGISLGAIEKELIAKALEKFAWNQSRAAQHLGISRKTLIYRMKKYDLCKSTYLLQQAAHAGY
jgi:DNA-binding NtrC family response regulator